jgi:hypothetical protein
MSCLFNSMSYFITDDRGSNGIRQRICDYLEQNLPIIEGMETCDVLKLEEAPSCEKYISNMRKLSTWGGAIEIQCACNIWNARIIVHDIRSRNNPNSNGNKCIEFVPLQTPIAIPSSSTNVTNVKPVELEFHLEWSGGHYEPRRHSN